MLKKFNNKNGLTLIELLIGITMVTILLTIAIASYKGTFSQHALVQRAESLFHFLRLANSQAIKLNKKIYVKFCQLDNSQTWKVALSEQSGCDCFTLNSCQLEGLSFIKDLADGKDIFTSETDITFSNEQASYSPMRFGINTGSVILTDVGGSKLKVIQSTMRLKICSLDKDQFGYSVC